MDLTKEQKENIKQLTEYLEKLEKKAVQDELDLDVFISEYKEDGYEIYATEQIDLRDTAGHRKKIFEKAGKEKLGKTVTAKSK